MFYRSSKKAIKNNDKFCMYVMCTKLLKDTQFYTHIVTSNDTDKQTYTKTHTMRQTMKHTL